MNPLTDILKTGAWAGRRAFVVGSGPGLDRSVLLNLKCFEKTIGCNEEFRWGPSIAICQDVRFFFGDGSPNRVPARYNPEWYGGPHIPVFFKGHPDRPDPHCDNPKIYTTQAAHSPAHKPDGTGLEWIWPKALEDGLYYGANVGMAALSLADVLGADPVYMLGMDCRSALDGRTHSHDHYGPDWSMSGAGPDHNKMVFSDWAKKWRAIAGRVRAHVVVVGDSKLVDDGVFFGIGYDELERTLTGAKDGVRST